MILIIIIRLLFLLTYLAFPNTLHAQTVRYGLELTLDDNPVIGGSTAMAINHQIPGPILRFQEGDDAVISVTNHLTEATSIHWHGLLVPNDQDGVPHLNMRPIEPGETRVFQFRLRHSGTYWYHSHSVLQEQLGLYGSIVIAPRAGESVKVDHDEVVVLSDWTNEHPNHILAQLRAGREWQAVKKNTIQTIHGAMEHRALKNLVMQTWTRMPSMDLSDVAYERFLVNGRPSQHISAQPGEQIRLRFINASASTYYFLEFAGGPAQIIAADGTAVQPTKVGRFLMAIAETYDVLVKLPEKTGSYEFRATAQDGSGSTRLFIGSGKIHPTKDVPKPNYYQSHDHASTDVSQPAPEQTMSGMEHAGHKMTMPEMQFHQGHAMHQDRQSKSHVESNSVMAEPERPGSPYEQLKAVFPSEIADDRPVRKFTFRLRGNMLRYVWMLDEKTFGEATTIDIHKGDKVRMTFINETMMHHPMHLHGHFFRLLTSAGKFSPWKHTVDVPPFSRRTIEFAADEPGDWMMHCHVLYHAEVGMARVIHYQASPANQHQAHQAKHAISEGNHHDPLLFFGEGLALSQMTEGFISWQNNRSAITPHWQSGFGRVQDAQYEVGLDYDRYFGTYLSTFVSYEWSNGINKNRGMLGIRYVLPFLIQSQVSIDTDGDGRLTLGKTLQISSRFSLLGRAQYDTKAGWELTTNFEYLIDKNLSALVQWHNQYGVGAGLGIRF